MATTVTIDERVENPKFKRRGKVKFQVGDRIKSGKDKGVIAGELRLDGYYPVKLDKHNYLSYGVVHIKPSGLQLTHKGGKVR